MSWLREGSSVPQQQLIRDFAKSRASFVVAVETVPLPAAGRVIGTGWGVRETATTTSDDHGLPHAQHGRTAAQKLAKYQLSRPPTRRTGCLSCAATV